MSKLASYAEIGRRCSIWQQQRVCIRREGECGMAWLLPSRAGYSLWSYCLKIWVVARMFNFPMCTVWGYVCMSVCGIWKPRRQVLTHMNTGKGGWFFWVRKGRPGWKRYHGGHTQCDSWVEHFKPFVQPLASQVWNYTAKIFSQGRAFLNLPPALPTHDTQKCFLVLYNYEAYPIAAKLEIRANCNYSERERSKIIWSKHDLGGHLVSVKCGPGTLERWCGMVCSLVTREQY